MALTELERIYLLKTEGVDKVLADIGQITDAFAKSYDAKAKLMNDPLTVADADSLKTTNNLLSQMVDIQNKLLVSLQGINTEFSKTNSNLENTGDAAKDASGGINALTDSAKTLGGSLTGAASGLLKVQTGLKSADWASGNAAITQLIEKLAVLNQRYALNKKAYQEQFSGDSGVVEFMEKLERNNVALRDGELWMGKIKLVGTELNETYEQLTGTINSANISYEQYLQMQMEITSQQGQLVNGVQTLNRVFNPAIPAEYTLQIKQLEQEMKLLAAGSEEAIAMQVRLDELRLANKSVKDDLSGKTEAENEKLLAQQDILKATNEQRIVAADRLADEAAADALLNKQLADEAAYKTYIADQEKQRIAQQRVTGNQELRGEGISNAYAADNEKLAYQTEAAQPENVAARRQRMQDERTEVEMLKNKNIVLAEETSYYQRLLAQVNLLRISLRNLTAEELANGNAGEIMQHKVSALDAELRSFNNKMGDSTRDIGKYGQAFKDTGVSILGVSNIFSIFSRQLVRGIGSIIIFQLLFDSVSKLGTALMTAIPGTDDYIKKQKELVEVFEQTQTALTGMITQAGKYDDAIRAALGIGTISYQAQLNLISGIGTLQGRQYEFEIKQFNAKQQLRQEEINDLDRVYTKYYALNALFRKVDVGGDYSVVKQQIKDLGLSFEDTKKFTGILEEFLKSRKDNPKAKLYDNPIIGQAIAEVSGRRNVLEDEKDNAQEVFDTKRNNAIYAKNIELYNELADLDMQFRQVKEHGDIASVDKIVGDTEAKYQAMYAKIRQDAVQWAKSIDVNVPQIDGANDVEDFDKEFEGLPQYIKDKYLPKIGRLDDIKKAQEVNDKIDNERKRLLSDTQFKSQSETVNAGFESYNAGNGYADYTKMADALDKVTLAKKHAFEAEADQHKEQLRSEAGTIPLGKNGFAARVALALRYAEVDKELQAKITQNTKEAYQQRLQLATDYFKRVTENADAASANTVAQLNNDTQVKINKILTEKLRGDISEARADKLTDRETNKGIIRTADATIDNATSDLKEAKKAVRTADDNVKMATTQDQLTEATKAYNKALADQLLLEGKITKAEHDKLIAEQKLKPKDYTKEIANGLIAIGETLANSYMELLAKEDAYRQEMAQRSLAWNQKVQGSEVQSNNEKMAQEKANMIASNELAKEKAQQDKKRAGQQLMINAAVAISKAAVADFGEGGLGAAKFFIDSGIILAQLAIQESMLARAPAYAQGTSGHPGGWAWVGDGHENELIKFGNQLAVSPNRPTLTNLPAGAEVTPFSKIANVPGNLGAGLSAPRFVSSASGGGGGGNNADMMQHVQTIYGMIGEMASHVSNIKTYVTAKDINKGQRNYSTKVRAI